MGYRDCKTADYIPCLCGLSLKWLAERTRQGDDQKDERAVWIFVCTVTRHKPALSFHDPCISESNHALLRSLLLLSVACRSTVPWPSELPYRLVRSRFVPCSSLECFDRRSTLSLSCNSRVTFADLQDIEILLSLLKASLCLTLTAQVASPKQEFASGLFHSPKHSKTNR